jgi:hypothetical protein
MPQYDGPALVAVDEDASKALNSLSKGDLVAVRCPAEPKFSFAPRRIFQPYASLMPASIQPAAKTPWARVLVKTANLECMRCVHSKLVVFTKALRGSRSKNTVCLPAPIQIFKKKIIQILRGARRGILRGRNLAELWPGQNALLR